MSYNASVLITTFQRPHLLKWGLESITKQNIPFEFETIVINDGTKDETEQVCNEFKDKLNLKYIFSGHRNLKNKIKWRIPGFAINIGANHATGEVLIISCAEMYHLNDTVKLLTSPVLNNPKLIGIPLGWDDDGSFLKQLKNSSNYNFSMLTKLNKLNVKFPFLMAINREEFFKINGYDEDFIGIGYDDRDFVDRLLCDNCKYYRTQAKTIHLYHGHIFPTYNPQRWIFNQNLYHERKGIIIRNINVEWGKIKNSGIY
jgi:glycosyltransferase involved in cell wall biosynthesis